MSKRWLAVWCSVTLLLSIVAAWELDRVASGQLFLFALRFDAEASVPELYDARESAAQWRTLSVVAVWFGSIFLLALSRSTGEPTTLSRPLIAFFLLSVVFDLVSTLWFFHLDGIDFELHPAVRLFGYAYGRTIGPVLAKGVQAVGVLFVATKLRRIGKPFLIGTTCVYSLAAIYNILN
jgi:hypothetical protein